MFPDISICRSCYGSQQPVSHDQQFTAASPTLKMAARCLHRQRLIPRGMGRVQIQKTGLRSAGPSSTFHIACHADCRHSLSTCSDNNRYLYSKQGFEAGLWIWIHFVTGTKPQAMQAWTNILGLNLTEVAMARFVG